MSETAHTPGPWQVKNDYDGRTEVIANVDGETFSDGTQSYSFDFICNTAWDWYGDDKDAATAAANARLISAAPDMLEALRKAVKQLESLGFDGSSSGADAAIAKATGEPVELREAS